MDFIAATEVANDVLAKARVEFAKLSSNGGAALLGLVNPKKPDELKSAALVSAYLNHCELVAVSIRNRAMDEQMYKHWRRTTYTRTWGRAEAYIAAKRRTLNQPTLYTNFEWLAKRWRPVAASP